MPGIAASFGTSVLVTLSCHLMHRVRRGSGGRKKLFTLFSYLAYVVYASQPYKKVLRMHA